MKNNNLDTINIVLRASKVIDILFESEEPLGVSTIAKDLSLPKSTTFRIVNTLVFAGLIHKNDEDLYSLGSKFILYGNKVKSSLSLKNLAEPIMKELAATSGESINLGIPYNEYVLTLNHCPGESSLLVSNLTPLSPLYCSSLGKIILAHMDDKSLREYFKQDLKQYTLNSITKYEHFIVEKKKFCESSIMHDNEEYEYGLSCYAAPIYDSNNDLIAALSISGPTTRMLVRGPEMLKKLLLIAAKKITNELEKSLYTVSALKTSLG